MDQGIPVNVIYLDFHKAFDKLSHTKLLFKLSGYDISDEILRWVQNLLARN